MMSVKRDWVIEL